LLLGLAYKKNTADARESPSRRVAELLVAEGAMVQAADPYVVDAFVPAGVVRVEATAEVVEVSDLVVLLVDHDAFDLDSIRSAASHVLDTRNVMRGPNVETL
jgi:UDP-N-acetyl-D-glucosamine dehydrogenase